MDDMKLNDAEVEGDWWFKRGGAAWLWRWEHFLLRFWRTKPNPVLDWEMDERLERVRAHVMGALENEPVVASPLTPPVKEGGSSSNTQRP